MNLSSRSDVRAYLEAHNLAPKKRFGQNFLLDRHHRDRVVGVVQAGEGDLIWEIGPGLGALTEGLLDLRAGLILFEVDWGLVRHLEREFGDRTVEIVAGDFRKTWQEAMSRHGTPTVVAGNLPYRLAATMIGDLLETALPCRQMVFTVQKEVAERMVAAPGTSAYSSFSVLAQVGATVRALFEIPPGAFLPVPEVDSSVVELIPNPDVDAVLMARLSRLVRACFAARRKTLRRNVAAAVDADGLRAAFEAEGIDLGLRAERVAPAEFAAVASRLTDHGA